MVETLTAVQALLVEIQEHLKINSKSDRSAAVAKLQRIAALSSTLALTIRLAK